jgi:hypothetical protein
MGSSHILTSFVVLVYFLVCVPIFICTWYPSFMNALFAKRYTQMLNTTEVSLICVLLQDILTQIAF